MSAEEQQPPDWCPALNRTFVDEPARAFKNTQAITSVHDKTPRFGHKNEISVLWENGNTGDERSDYLTGMVSAAIAMAIFFLVWVLVLLVLKCLGHDRVGFFSGRATQRPAKPQPPTETTGIEVVVLDDGEESLIKGHQLGEDPTHFEESEGSSDEAANQAEEGRPESEDQGEEEQSEANGADDAMNINEKVLVDSDPSVTNEQDYNEHLQDDYEELLVAWEKNVAKIERRMRRIRVAVLFCCVATVVCVILMIVYGVKSLVKSLDSAQDGLVKGQDLAHGAIAIIDDFLLRQEGVNQVSPPTDPMHGINARHLTHLLLSLGTGWGPIQFPWHLPEGARKNLQRHDTGRMRLYWYSPRYH
jgi:hypothetical protein